MTTDNTEREEPEPPERIWVSEVVALSKHKTDWHAHITNEKVDEGDIEYVRAAVAAPQGDALLSLKELADAALSSLERIDTAKLAALGRDRDAESVGNARRFLDRLLYEARSVVDRYHGELWIDKEGFANFRFHIEGGDFTSAREALVAFVEVLQKRLNAEQDCPYYEALSPATPSLIPEQKRRCDECEAENGWHRTACPRHPRFATPPAATSGAREAADEIIGLEKPDVNRVEAIILKHLSSAQPVGEQKQVNYDFEFDQRCFYCRNKYCHTKHDHDASVLENTRVTSVSGEAK